MAEDRRRHEEEEGFTQFFESKSLADMASWTHLCSVIVNAYGHALVVKFFAALSLVVLYLYIQGYELIDFSGYDAVVVDHVLAAVGVSFPIGYVIMLNMYYSESDDSVSIALLLLRVTSCCIIGVAMTIFLAEYFTRRILISLVLMGYGAWGFFYSWSVPVWRWYMYSVCKDGLIVHLPESLQTMLLQTTLLEWLTDTTFFDNMQKYMPFLMPLSPTEQQRVVRSLPPESQEMMLKPGLIHLLPSSFQDALLPEKKEEILRLTDTTRSTTLIVPQTTPSYSFGFEFETNQIVPQVEDPTVMSDLISSRISTTVQQIVSLPSPKLVNRTAAISSFLFVFQLTRSVKARAQFFLLCRVVLLSLLGTIACTSVSIRCLQVLTALPQSSQRYLVYIQRFLIQNPSILRLRNVSQEKEESKPNSRWNTVSKSVMADDKAVADVDAGIAKLGRITSGIKQKASLFGTPQDTRANHDQLNELAKEGHDNVQLIGTQIQKLTTSVSAANKSAVRKLTKGFQVQVEAFEKACSAMVEAEKSVVQVIRKTSIKQDPLQHAGFDYNEDQLYAQAQVSVYNEDDLARREEDIVKINHQLREIKATYQELDGLVQDQEEVVIQITNNTEDARENARDGLENIMDAPRMSSMDASPLKSPNESLLRDVLLNNMTLMHHENNASILETNISSPTPWTPKSLGRAKSAIIYRQTLNDNLLFLERNIFFFSEWHMRFVSLQEDHILIYSCREKWEQGHLPDKVIRLNPMMFLSHMKVEVDEKKSSETTRLFRRKILETDELDEWINDELRQGLVVGSTGSNISTTFSNNPQASTRVVLEFATTNQSTFELWSKCLRRTLQSQKEESIQHMQVSNNSIDNFKRGSTEWISPGHDCKVTLHQSEIWCNRVALSDEKDKAESEYRRIIAMEKLVAQVTGPPMALLVYEKVSRVHELFAANSRREIESGVPPIIKENEEALSAKVLHFFSDHLKRKYAVFLILALAHGIQEEYIREAHERMCAENQAAYAGVGGGTGQELEHTDEYGFADEASIELYDKYRTAALNYYRMNYGDPSAAEEEDAIMHLPVMLHVAIIRQEKDEANAMLEILDMVKRRLLEPCSNN
ncbi:hypothetical protein THRCLA_12217 [Thraustotheca clavata]|uniref:t-SNARE coiled-coil homology domain-containing protein n=1 Tax=Thraustotheca clavata TaxID=74557 RepID=A0A1V9ZXU2_9STRA|nr:hypothetical protein THRCLA_12217 [Thraustotheca clavata]